MRIKRIEIEGFRGYKDRTQIDFDDLTVFVGKNDVGKSTVLEALDLFFNDGKGVIKYDKSDISVGSDQNEYVIGVVFVDIPEKVIVDASYETTLKDEYLLNEDGNLEIIKKYNGSKNTGVYIRALHPTDSRCDELHLKKKNDLKALLKEYEIECENQAINAVMRKAIWKRFENELHLATKDIDVNAGDDTKKIWVKLSCILPIYSLFQSDRQNSDGDKEVQDPLKLAVSQFLQDEALQETLRDVAEKVESKLQEVADRTLEKLKEMDPNVAESLNPVIPSAESLKWTDVFKGVSITSNDDIPINKRGSGVKRLVLLNFFRAEAERRKSEGDNTGVIYAIEEPETSQHFENQKILIHALITLSKTTGSQVILTSHSGVIVKELEYDNLRLIFQTEDGEKKVEHIQNGLLSYPSLNEVNYLAFGEITEEYHDELYGFIFENQWLQDYEKGKSQVPYIRDYGNGKTKNETRTLTHYIRDVMHHPENKYNQRYTLNDLAHSISDMRSYIEGKCQVKKQSS